MSGGECENFSLRVGVLSLHGLVHLPTYHTPSGQPPWPRGARLRRTTPHTQGTPCCGLVMLTCAHQPPALPGEPLLTRLRALVWLRRSTLRGGRTSRTSASPRTHRTRLCSTVCRRCVQLRFGALCAPHIPPRSPQLKFTSSHTLSSFRITRRSASRNS